MVKVLINSDSEINAINTDFAKNLGFQVRKTKVGDQMIDGTKLDTFGMVITSFLIEDKEKISRFFEETFLLADTSMNIALGILFFTLSNVEINLMDYHIY